MKFCRTMIIAGCLVGSMSLAAMEDDISKFLKIFERVQDSRERAKTFRFCLSRLLKYDMCMTELQLKAHHVELSKFSVDCSADKELFKTTYAWRHDQNRVANVLLEYRFFLRALAQMHNTSTVLGMYYKKRLDMQQEEKTIELKNELVRVKKHTVALSSIIEDIHREMAYNRDKLSCKDGEIKEIVRKKDAIIKDYLSQLQAASEQLAVKEAIIQGLTNNKMDSCC